MNSNLETIGAERPWAARPFASPQPFVSVIMPIRNEEDFIARTLGAVLAQDYPHDKMEVLIADGMSTDGTRAIIARLAAASDVAVHVLDNVARIVPTGLNLALERAKGEIIVRVDGHTIIAPDYVSACVFTLETMEADNVGGRMDAVADGPFGEAIALATSSPFGVGGARFHYAEKDVLVDTVYMGAWRREVFERIGLFDEELVRNQDDEFNYRLRAHQGKIVLSTTIRSEYHNRNSLRALWKQYFEYGYWKVRVMQKHRQQMRPRQYVPPAFVAVVLGGALFMPFSRALRRLWLALLGVYALANAVASLWVASRKGIDSLLRMPMTFATLHFAYGSGFLLGLIKFASRWNEVKTEKTMPTSAPNSPLPLEGGNDDHR
jgi:glycosyltransferase involved in cell wall biosynthesis